MNTISPKLEFISNSKAADNHQEMMLNPAFKRACESALLEYVMTLSTSTLQSAAETAYRIEGAKGFLNVLLNLGERVKPPTTRSPDELDPV